MVGPKKQDFWPIINILRGNVFKKKIIEEYQSMILVGVFKRFFLGGMPILGQKPYFLGPIVFKIS